jgi:hypothetical protein
MTGAWDHDSYVATGGARLAEAAFAELEPVQQGIARQALVRLAADGLGGEVMRRRVELSDLQTEGEGQVRAVLELLADRRLLTLRRSVRRASPPHDPRERRLAGSETRA